jgi:hypothetical protein
MQLCAHQQLEPRALCSILNNLARLVSAQQPQQQQQKKEEQQQDVPRTAAGLPQPLMQQLLAATQQVLESAAAAGAARRQQEVTVLLDGQQQALNPCHCQQQQQQQQRRRQQPQQWQPPQQQQLPRQLNTTQQVQQQDWHVLRMQSAPAGSDWSPPFVKQELLVASIQTPVQPLQRDHVTDSKADHQQQQDQQQQDEPRLRQGLAPAGLVTLADALRRLKADPPSSWQVAYIAGNDGWCETWAWGGVSKHVG